ncbi:MAG: hypothetical protein AMS27_03515 [Bacteroides sp. SM23_62_1]|nr:MAG: hypothetical protein AMS27_03515 [Bacteroides sp. SM23_62_1]
MLFISSAIPDIMFIELPLRTGFLQMIMQIFADCLFLDLKFYLNLRPGSYRDLCQSTGYNNKSE